MNTIAVLPFRNLSSNQEHAFFADGITEEIINGLAQIEQLKVTSRTSSFALKDEKLSVAEIVQKLNVAFLLEGSVRILDYKVRIQANLIETENDFQFWSKSWNRELTNIFEVQDEISLLIADQLREHLGHIEIQDHLVHQQTSSIDAYTLSLEAKQLFNKWNPTDIKKAIELFNKALEIDPYHAESYVGLADAHGFLGTTQFADPIESWKKVDEYTHKALELNPNNAGAHYQLANLAFFTQFDFASAYKHTEQSIKNKPNYPEAQQFMAFLNICSGDMKTAQKHLEVALEIDPLSQETLFYQSYFEYRSHHYQRAIELTDDCLAKNPHNIPAYTVKVYALLALGEYKRATEYANAQPDEIVVPTDKTGVLCMALALKSNLGEDFQLLFDKLQEEALEPHGIQAHAYLYKIHSILNEPDKAFYWVEKSKTYKSPVMLLTFGGPFTENLRKDPRYDQWHKELYFVNKSSQNEVTQTNNILLDEQSARDFEERLITYFQEEEPYLMPDLSLRSLANELSLHPNQLSWLINQKLKKNFNGFVNGYRIQHFQKIALNPDNSHISLIGLAYESGFNSKTAFNTYFKKETGLTPKAWIKQAT